MKHSLRLIALALALALALLPALALAAEDAFGSAAVDEVTAYTLEEMLTFAMQDEYLAEAEYITIQETFGVDNPFTSIMGAEVTHQDTLLKLFDTYGIPVPENTAAEHVVIPETLQETYEVGILAEIANIAMYEAFLAQNDLPQDVINAFTALMTASQSHLQAFQRNAENDGIQLKNDQNSNESQTQQTTQAGEATDTRRNDQNQNGNGGK